MSDLWSIEFTGMLTTTNQWLDPDSESCVAPGVAVVPSYCLPLQEWNKPPPGIVCVTLPANCSPVSVNKSLAFPDIEQYLFSQYQGSILILQFI